MVSKSGNGVQVYAAAIESGVPIPSKYAAYLKAQEGDYVVVGNQLVDRKSGKVIFSAPTSKMGQSRDLIQKQVKWKLSNQMICLV